MRGDLLRGRAQSIDPVPGQDRPDGAAARGNRALPPCRAFHGWLTALLLAHQGLGRVLSFADIEGNLAPEDCFLSRQVLTHPSGDAEDFFGDFIKRTRRSPSYASALFAASLRHKVRPGAVRGIFESMVDLSDDGDVMASSSRCHARACSCTASRTPPCRTWRN